jgi:hypothetical protein
MLPWTLMVLAHLQGKLEDFLPSALTLVSGICAIAANDKDFWAFLAKAMSLWGNFHHMGRCLDWSFLA